MTRIYLASAAILALAALIQTAAVLTADEKVEGALWAPFGGVAPDRLADHLK